MSCGAPPTDRRAGATGGPARGPRRLIYGRRGGPRLRPARRTLLDELLPALAVELPAEGRLEPRALFGRGVRSVRLEIGFGGGEHLEAEAAAHPEVGYLGVEPFVAGVARLLAGIAARRLDNVRILVDDARLLLEALPDASLERVDVLFPDPWPKTRHHKRRIVAPATMAQLARTLVRGGELRLATDDPGYARWMLRALLGEPRLAWVAERAADWRDPWPDHARTRYEAKALAAGRRPVFLRALRRDDDRLGLA